MGTTLYAAFNDTDSAERAVGALLDYGVRSQDVSLVRKRDESAQAQISSEAPPIPENPAGSSSAPVNETGSDWNVGYKPSADRAVDEGYDNLSASAPEDAYDAEAEAKTGITPTTPSDAAVGAIKGAGIGLGIGSIAALAAIFVPGFGLIIGGGALAVALGGLAATTGAGAIEGAVTGYLKDQGMDSNLAERFGASVTEGGALVSVEVPSAHVDESTARSILDKYGAVQVTDFAGRMSGGYVA